MCISVYFYSLSMNCHYFILENVLIEIITFLMCIIIRYVHNVNRKLSALFLLLLKQSKRERQSVEQGFYP